MGLVGLQSHSFELVLGSQSMWLLAADDTTELVRGTPKRTHLTHQTNPSTLGSIGGGEY
jgi:hypothetical protein